MGELFGTILLFTWFLPSSPSFWTRSLSKTVKNSCLKFSQVKFLSISTVLNSLALDGYFFKHSSSIFLRYLSVLLSYYGSCFKVDLFGILLSYSSTLAWILFLKAACFYLVIVWRSVNFLSSAL